MTTLADLYTDAECDTLEKLTVGLSHEHTFKIPIENFSLKLLHNIGLPLMIIEEMDTKRTQCTLSVVAINILFKRAKQHGKLFFQYDDNT